MRATEKKHIVFVCSRLDLPGGIERAIVNTANLLVKNEFNVTLLVLDETDHCFYHVLESVRIKQVHLSFGIVPEGNVLTRKVSFMQDIYALRKELLSLNPDTIIATEYPFSIAIVLARLKRKVQLVSWEHHHLYEMPKNTFWRSLFAFAYPRLDGIVCLNQDEENLFSRYNKNVSVIPNFCVDTSPNPTQLSGKKRLLTIGRLTHVKGTDLLLPVAAQVLKRHLDWEWKLIGEGDMHEEVNQFIKANMLQQQLLLQKPLTPSIEHEYRDASIYVMTSRNECFPMTLLEAMQEGAPCVAFDCETGPRAIIQHNENGMLIEPENINAMAAALQLLMNDVEKRERMGEVAFRSMERFSAKKILSQWEHLFSTL